MIVHFASGTKMSLNLPDEMADAAIRRMNIDPNGTTLITSDNNGNAYLINRVHMTHVTVEA